MVTILLPKKYTIGRKYVYVTCAFAYNVQPMCKNCKMPNTCDCEALMINDLGG
jgi:hypothetical protein